MGALVNILYNSIGSLFLGILLTVVGIALMFYLIKSWLKNNSFTPISFCVGAVLFLFLSYQSILLCGAFTIKGYTSKVEHFINNLVERLPKDIDFSQKETQNILDKICDEFPVVGYYVEYADFQGHTPLDIAEAMADELNTYMNWYIVRRILWSLMFVVVGAIIVIKTMDRRKKRYVRHSHKTMNKYDD